MPRACCTIAFGVFRTAAKEQANSCHILWGLYHFIILFSLVVDLFVQHFKSTKAKSEVVVARMYFIFWEFYAPKLHLGYETRCSGGSGLLFDHLRILSVRRNLDPQAFSFFVFIRKHYSAVQKLTIRFNEKCPQTDSMKTFMLLY